MSKVCLRKQLQKSRMNIKEDGTGNIESISKLKLNKKKRSKSPYQSNKAFIEFKKQLPRFDILYGQPLPYDSSLLKSSRLPKLYKHTS